MNLQPFSMFIAPPWMQQAQQRPDERVPRRVAVAVHMLEHLTAKTQSRIAVNEIGMDSFPGQELEPEEMQVFGAACKLLCRYMDGSLVPTEAEKKEQAAPVRRTLMRCVHCGGAGRVPTRGSTEGAPCDLCEGTGNISVIPATG